jgi:hypothetical protein
MIVMKGRRVEGRKTWEAFCHPPLLADLPQRNGLLVSTWKEILQQNHLWLTFTD